LNEALAVFDGSSIAILFNVDFQSFFIWRVDTS
jgi:hypothetical protein